MEETIRTGSDDAMQIADWKADGLVVTGDRGWRWFQLLFILPLLSFSALLIPPF